MVMDSDAQIMYVFGGRVVDGDWNSVKYSGLYSYNVRLNKWKLLQYVKVNSRSILSMNYDRQSGIPTLRTQLKS